MSPGKSEASLRVMIVDDDPTRTDWIKEQLIQLGLDVCATVNEPLKVLKAIADARPEIVLIDMDSPGRDILDSLAIVAEQQPIPVVMFSAEEDPAYISRAVGAGVSTYLVGNIEPKTVQPVIEAAMAQFKHFQELRAALAESQSELKSRRQIDKAKYALMRCMNISEDEAYEHMRAAAMNASEPLVNVANRLLTRLDKRGVSHD